MDISSLSLMRTFLTAYMYMRLSHLLIYIYNFFIALGVVIEIVIPISTNVTNVVSSKRLFFLFASQIGLKNNLHLLKVKLVTAYSSAIYIKNKTQFRMFKYNNYDIELKLHKRTRSVSRVNYFFDFFYILKISLVGFSFVS